VESTRIIGLVQLYYANSFTVSRNRHLDD